jgi:hypothetical protein
MEAADRAAAEIDASQYPDLSAILTAYPEHVRAGAIYPDWGYLFPQHSGSAEDAHWAPFHTTALEYLHDTYGEPWSQHAEKLFAFICGMGCHGAMDDVWHFGSTSFLNQATQNDFPDLDPDDAEMLIEVLTDFFVQADHRSATYERYGWWIPVRDLLAIHHRENHWKVTPDAMIAGSAAQQVGLFLEDLLWPIVSPLASPALPWTRANYLTWWDGGLEDGSTASARRMEALWGEYQVIAASQPSSGGGFTPPTHRHHGAPSRDQWLEMAYRLLEEGVIEPRWRETLEGAVQFQTPEIKDWNRVLAEVRSLLRL